MLSSIALGFKQTPVLIIPHILLGIIEHFSISDIFFNISHHRHCVITSSLAVEYLVGDANGLLFSSPPFGKSEKMKK